MDPLLMKDIGDIDIQASSERQEQELMGEAFTSMCQQRAGRRTYSHPSKCSCFSRSSCRHWPLHCGSGCSNPTSFRKHPSSSTMPTHREGAGSRASCGVTCSHFCLLRNPSATFIRQRNDPSRAWFSGCSMTECTRRKVCHECG